MEQETEVDFCVNCGIPIDSGKTMCGLCGPYPPIDQEAAAEATLARPSRLTIMVIISLVIALVLMIFS